MTIKELFKKLEELEKITEKLENDETKEDEWNEAYEREFAAHEILVNEIVKISAGRIERKTANAMLITKRNELKAIIARLA